MSTVKVMVTTLIHRKNSWSTKLNGLTYVQVHVRIPRYLLGRERGVEINSLWYNTVDHLQSLLEGLRNWSGVRVLDGLWHLLRHDSCLPSQHSWATYSSPEGKNTSRLIVNIWHFPHRRKFSHLSQLSKGSHDKILQLGLFPSLAQTPPSC